LELASQLRQELPDRSAESIQQVLVNEGFMIGRSTLDRLLRQQGLGVHELKNQSKPLVQIEPTRWMLRILQNSYSYSEIKDDLGDIKELKSLLQFATFGKFNERNMALSILARSKRIPTPTISQFLRVPQKTIYNYFKRYKADSFDVATFAKRSKKRPLKFQQREYIDAVFSLLHHPPSEFGINRTSWKIMDLKSCLKKQGISLNKNAIGKIVRGAGYKWKKAKTVLTSNDPDYRPKLEHIKEILSSLKIDERFFSCDEFGPFAIKMIPGRKLVAPEEYPQVPQYQKSRGSLILTGALELSTNQITHFYSEKKNTDEMIRLLDVLLTEYKSITRIYISWDSASWHISK
jgi:transposase